MVVYLQTKFTIICFILTYYVLGHCNPTAVTVHCQSVICPFKAVTHLLLYFCMLSDMHHAPRTCKQGRIQKYGLGGREGVGFRLLPFPSPPLSLPSPTPSRSSTPLPLEVGPFNPARGSGGAL